MSEKPSIFKKAGEIDLVAKLKAEQEKQTEFEALHRYDSLDKGEFPKEGKVVRIPYKPDGREGTEPEVEPKETTKSDIEASEGMDCPSQTEKPVIVRIAKANRIVIPKRIAEAINVKVGDYVKLQIYHDGKLVVERVQI